MKLKYTLQFDRIAVLTTPQGFKKIGDITHFEQKPNGDLEMIVDLTEGLPKPIQDAITKDPGLIGIQSKPKIVTNLLVLR